MIPGTEDRSGQNSRPTRSSHLGSLGTRKNGGPEVKKKK